MMSKNQIIVLTAAGLVILGAVVMVITIQQGKYSESKEMRTDIVGSSSKKNNCTKETGSEIVMMKGNEYEPRDLSIKKCTKVIFKNVSSEPHWPASDIHPTHGIYPEFDPKQPAAAGSEWSFVFDRVGTWKYHDHLDPATRGVIEVSE